MRRRERHPTYRFGLILLGMLVVVACGAGGGVEGHYTIDRKLTATSLSRYTEEEVRRTYSQMYGKNAKVPDEIFEQALQETQSVMDKIELDLFLDPGGKFRGTAKMDEERTSAEGTWAVSQGQLITTQTLHNGKPLHPPKSETLHYQGGLLTFADPGATYPFLVLSKAPPARP